MGIIAEILRAKEAEVWPWQFKRTSVLDCQLCTQRKLSNQTISDLKPGQKRIYPWIRD